MIHKGDSLDLKEEYAVSHAKTTPISFYLNGRLFETYNTIATQLLKKRLQGVNIDLGSGDRGFTQYCENIGITSYPYDYPHFNIEKDILPHENEIIDFITLNAVIEHIEKPAHIFEEIFRVLKKDGVVFIRTPNWQLDYKNFYNDPTHIKPYTPKTLETILNLFGFDPIFIEPGLIQKAFFWWKLPAKIKWHIASWIPGGTKSILAIGLKK